MSDERVIEGMRLDEPLCPECGQPAIGTADWIPGIALFGGDPSREPVHFCGQTDVEWDGQYAQETRDGRTIVACRCGRTWPTRIRRVKEKLR